MPLIKPSKFKSTCWGAVCCLLLLGSFALSPTVSRADVRLEIYSLQHRPAADVIEALRGILPPHAAIEASGQDVLVRADAVTQFDIKRLLEQLDKPVESFLLTLAYVDALQNDQPSATTTRTTRAQSATSAPWQIRGQTGQWLHVGLQIVSSSRTETVEGFWLGGYWLALTSPQEPARASEQTLSALVWMHAGDTATVQLAIRSAGQDAKWGDFEHALLSPITVPLNTWVTVSHQGPLADDAQSSRRYQSHPAPIRQLQLYLQRL